MVEHSSSSYSLTLHHRYVFAKTTSSGLTRFYALRLNSAEGTALFEYRPEGLNGGFRTTSIPGLTVADGQFHHLAVSVYDNGLSVYLDGQLHHQTTLTGALEDGQGIVSIGGLPAGSNFFSGVWMRY